MTSDGHQSCYDLTWLACWQSKDGEPCLGHGDLALRSRRPWYADHYPQVNALAFQS